MKSIYSVPVYITDFSMSRVKGTVFFAKKEDVDSFKRVEDYHSAEGYDVYQAGNSVNGEVWKVINVIKQVTP